MNGAVADAIGIQDAMRLQTIVVLVAIPVALLLPTEGRIEEMHAR